MVPETIAGEETFLPVEVAPRVGATGAELISAAPTAEASAAADGAGVEEPARDSGLPGSAAGTCGAAAELDATTLDDGFAVRFVAARPDRRFASAGSAAATRVVSCVFVLAGVTAGLIIV